VAGFWPKLCIAVLLVEVGFISYGQAAYESEFGISYKDAASELRGLETYGLRYRQENWELHVTTGSLTAIIAGYVFPLLPRDFIFVPHVFFGGGYFLGMAAATGAGARVNLGPVGLRLDNYLYLIGDPRGVVTRIQLLTMGISFMW